MGELDIPSCRFVSAENNVPFITINGLNESLTRQWTVLSQSSITFTTSDADGDRVTMYGWMPLPPGSSLTSQTADTWEFAWTPANMDPVELV